VRRAWGWLLSTIAGGLVWWAITVGGGVAVSAVVAAVSGIDQPWVSLLAVGVFMATAGLLLALLRAVVVLLPRNVRRAVRPPRPVQPFALPAILTPQGQLTTLIEEGQTLAQVVPAPGDQRNRLVLMLAGADINYPARVYEWEMRVWRLLSGPSLSQYRGLFPRPDEAHRLDRLREHVEERVRQLQTILARV
jgi:hypothetical protein